MTRLHLAVVGVLAAGGLAARADEGKPVTIIARGPWPHMPTHVGPADRDVHQYVIRGPDELAKAAGAGGLVTVPRALKVDAIDFKTHMLLAVEDGSMPLVGVSGGGPPSSPATVAVTAAEKDAAGKTLTVTWRRADPPRGVLLTRPLEVVLVERFDGEVQFRRVDVKDKAGPAGKAVKVEARATFADGWPPEAPRREWVVRGEKELVDPRIEAPEPVIERMRREAVARYAAALKVDGIDFTEHMVMGVSGGVQPAGSRVEVTGVRRDDRGDLTVRWRLHGPPAGAKPAGIEHPAAVVLVARSAGQVRFVRDK